MNMFEEVVESNWSPPEMLPALRGATMVAIDLETHDPSMKTHGAGWAYEGRGAVVGFALATPEHGSFYLPVAHGGGGNLDLGAVTRFMRELCSRPIPKIMHNALYDTGWLRRAGIEVTGPIYDTMFAACLLDENRFSYSLDNVAKEWIGVGKDESLLDAAAKARYGAKAKSKEVLWKLPANFVGRYAEVDAETTLDLFRFCKQRLEKDNLWKLFELECSLIPMLVDMRWNGIRVDVDEAGKVREMLLAKEKALLAEIKRKWRVSVDVWSAASIASAFDQEGLDYPTTDKGAASFRKGWLEAHPHELAKAVVDVRKYNKASSTFIDGMILGHTVKGRIHCELHPLKSDDGGTVSGRFSCSSPNLQQVPARDPEIGPLIRSLFLPEEGTVWGAFDYASQEPRLTVHFAHRAKQAGAAKAVEGYTQNPRMDYHQMVADMAGIGRKQAKGINLGLAYGMGGVKLCHELGLPTEFTERGYEVPGEEGKALLDTYNAKVPYVKGLSDMCSRRATDVGFIRTYGGRLCRFDLYEAAKGREGGALPHAEALAKWGPGVRRAYTHKALNRLIQGSAADMTKLAMAELWRQGIIPMMQMHDELDVSVESKVQADLITQCMVECVKLDVPVVVDAEFGPNWGGAKYSWEQYHDR